MTGDQLDLLPALAAMPEPHPYRPADTVTGAGPCDCGSLRLDAVHYVPPPVGAARFFDQLDRIDAERAAVMLDTAEARRDDLVALAKSDRHADDTRFNAGLAWGIALAERVIKAARGESDPACLRFSNLPAA